MKSELCIESFKEIPVQKQQEMNGGFLPFLGAVALLAISRVIVDWDNFKNGLMGRVEYKTKP